MSWSSWFHRLFDSDAQSDYCAKVFAALLVSGEVLDMEKLEQAKGVGEILFPAGPQRERFASMLVFYMESCVTEELDLNALVKRITAATRKNPEWLAAIPEEAYAQVWNPGVPLQQRVFEMLENLKSNGFTAGR